MSVDLATDDFAQSPAVLHGRVFDVVAALEDRLFAALQPGAKGASSSASSLTVSSSSSHGSVDQSGSPRADAPDMDTIKQARSTLRGLLLNWRDGTIGDTAACQLLDVLRDNLKREVRKSDQQMVIKCILFVRESCSTILRLIAGSSVQTYAAIYPHKAR